MQRYVAMLAPAALALAAPAAAQTVSGIFTESGDRIVAGPVHLSFPKAVAGLTFTGTEEFSHKGEKLDNGIQYEAPNGVWATIYVYRPGYPDAGLTAFDTDRVLPMIYGKALVRKSESVTTFAGQAASAIRFSYTGAVRDGKALATAAAFARVGGWIIKFRASGPAERQADVDAALDALVTASRLDGKARVFPVAIPSFADPCPAAPSGTAKAVTEKNAMGAAFFATLGGSIENDLPKNGDNPLPPSFPANGLTKMCLRGPLDTGSDVLPVLQPAGTATPDTIIVLLGDNGDAVIVSKELVGKGYVVRKAGIGQVTVFGTLDRMPDNGELLRLFKGQIPDAGKVQASVTFNADGNSAINIDMPKK